MTQNTPHTIFLVAGEASGDLLGAHLMRALKQKYVGGVHFVGVGGPRMKDEGLSPLFPYTDLMHFGIVEVLRHIPHLLKRIHQTARAVRTLHADALITIDSPDFCFRVAKLVKKDGRRKIPLIHYVAPTVWAWRPGRAKKIAKFLDLLLALLPFEPPYFTREGLGCAFVGHPLVEADIPHADGKAFRIAYAIDDDALLLTLLPGSRQGELTRLLPVFRDTVALLHKQFADLRIVIPTVAHVRARVQTEVASWPVPVIIVEGERDKYAAFNASRAALACSGTVALELALARLPAVIAYKLNALTVFLFKRFVRVKYANLINIMHDKMLVPEFLQDQCTPQNLAGAVAKLLTDNKAYKAQRDGLAAAAEWLGSGQTPPSERAANAVVHELEKFDLKPTVLQVLPTLVTGGVERGTIETVAALHQAGFHALVASAGGPMSREVEQAGGTHITLPLASKNPFVIVANIGRLRRLIKAHNVDIVHARSRAPAWSAYAAARLCHVRYVTTFHNAYGATWWGKRLYNSAMAKGARVIAISDFVGDYAEQVYGVARVLMRIIARGVDITVFDRDKVTLPRLNALRKAWGLQTQRKVILMPGRLTRWKGQSVLIAALAKLPRLDYTCVIVGGGKDTPYGQELAHDIAKAGLSDNIALFDTCRDMPAAYALADLVMVPSTRPEGFGRVVIEAQALGVPVIATNHGGARETIIPGQTGWLVEPDNAEELADAIDKTLDLSQEERRSLAARCIDHIRQNFTTARMTEKTLAVYRELLD